jgi:hypothetical protein
MAAHKKYNLKEIKIALDWAKQKLDVAYGSKHSNPQKYEETFQIYNKVKKLFDDECLEWIEFNCS